MNDIGKALDVFFHAHITVQRDSSTWGESHAAYESEMLSYFGEHRRMNDCHSRCTLEEQAAMKGTNFSFSIRKFVITSVTSCFVILVFSEAACGTQTSLPGGKSIELDGPLAGKMKDRFADGWSKAIFIGKDGQRLQLLSEEKLTKNGGAVFEGFDQRNVSVSGHFVVLPVVRQGTLETGCFPIGNGWPIHV